MSKSESDKKSHKNNAPSRLDRFLNLFRRKPIQETTPQPSAEQLEVQRVAKEASLAQAKIETMEKHLGETAYLSSIAQRIDQTPDSRVESALRQQSRDMFNHVINKIIKHSSDDSGYEVALQQLANLLKSIPAVMLATTLDDVYQSLVMIIPSLERAANNSHNKNLLGEIDNIKSAIDYINKGDAVRRNITATVKIWRNSPSRKTNQ
ncbi:MAG: hypothetical protein V4490_06100 [Pseudomonadota bacterium]